MFYKVIDRNASETIIVCSSIHTEVGRFRFERQLNEYPVNAILLNCPNNEWYLNGVPGLGDTPREVRSQIKKIIRERFLNTRVFGFGSSMGASGLILLTAGLEMERTFAFCPEIDLFDDYSFSKQHFKGTRPEKNDIWQEFKEHSNLKIFYGEECEHDLYQLQKIKGCSDVPTQTFSHQPHGVIEAIYFTEQLDGIMHSLISGKTLAPAKIKTGHISGSKLSCSVLWSAFLAWKKRGPAPQMLWRLLDEVPKDRSYLPLMLFWASRFASNEDRIKLLEQAFSLAPLSLRVAAELFSLVPDKGRSDDFKQKFSSYFGEKYVQSSRSHALAKF